MPTLRLNASSMRKQKKESDLRWLVPTAIEYIRGTLKEENGKATFTGDGKTFTFERINDKDGSIEKRYCIQDNAYWLKKELRNRLAASL